MSGQKHVPDLLRNASRSPACAKPWHILVAWTDASAGAGRSDEIMHAGNNR
jgi:hypothetical protein